MGEWDELTHEKDLKQGLTCRKCYYDYFLNNLFPKLNFMSTDSLYPQEKGSTFRLIPP